MNNHRCIFLSLIRWFGLCAVFAHLGERVCHSEVGNRWLLINPVLVLSAQSKLGATVTLIVMILMTRYMSTPLRGPFRILRESVYQWEFSIGWILNNPALVPSVQSKLGATHAYCSCHGMLSPSPSGIALHINWSHRKRIFIVTMPQDTFDIIPSFPTMLPCDAVEHCSQPSGIALHINWCHGTA